MAYAPLTMNQAEPASAPIVGKFNLRRAEMNDARAIRRLIYRAGINPLGLDWRRFWVVVEGGNLIACGQIKTHRDGSRELASIAVVPGHRQRGFARAVIEQLLSEENEPLFLTCRPHLESLYIKFGFRNVVQSQEMPPYFRRVWKIARFIQRLFSRFDGLLVMRRPGLNS